ncbi:MAG: hypothetical protein JJD98_02640 [Polaromonas sp.]|nr:hypothetical protein [Polaromonas sp.]
MQQTLFDLFGSPVLAFGTFLLGLLIGHRFALGRDRRKEFNDAVRPIRAKLLEGLGRVNYMSYIPDAIDSHDLKIHMSRRQWRATSAALNAYKEACGNYRQDEIGGPSLVNPVIANQALDRLISTLPHA